MKGNETICAIATPVGIGGVGVVRISGEEAVKIASRVLTRALVERPNHIMVNEIKDETGVVDIVMVVFFKKPKSYTGEDMVEIYCHGGRYVPNRIVEILIENGARLARPGEFTMRAVLHGKMDLIQAESVLDLVEAKSTAVAKVAIENLKGRISKRINRIASNITDLLIQVEGNLDFPDDENWLTITEIRKRIDRLKREVEKIIEGGRDGLKMREGPLVVITGRKNVGKSTLFNRLLGVDRAIVTPIPGTTRDYLVEELRLGANFVRLVDTAGIGATEDEIEEEGIRRSKELIQESDLVLLILDRSEEITDDDLVHLEMTREKERIITLNKSDLKRKIEAEGDIEVSARTGTGIEELRRMITGRLFKVGDHHLLRTRQIDALIAVKDNLSRAVVGDYLEMVASDLRNGLDAIGTLTGRITNEEILNRIFSEFCIGK
ncbi:MAG TPA: tRNA uridine-5-carboxymethylaminomethyl(34) synthesis GTPase MnmE [bacterium (Candidatus Stahlbacteria)]|nr:tRNA uridine-5-carboxymethylaminomethyl(34) synthesis GTPase MnmE [Candidatus Stahlbacteria bacterium]